MTRIANPPGASKIAAGGAGLLLLLASTGCGAAERDRLRREVNALRYDVAQTRQHNDDLKRRMRLTETRNRVLISLVRGLTAEPAAPPADPAAPGQAKESLAAIDRDLDELAITARQSRQDVEALRGERTRLRAQLQQALDAIEATRAREQAARDRLEALRDALARAGTREGAIPEPRIVDDRIVLPLPDSLLFERGQSTIQRAGRLALDAIASALREVPDLRLEIDGHAAIGAADRSAAYETAWQLSAARAAKVTQYLSVHGVDKARLSSVAYADTRPLDSDPALDHQRVNRRVELVLQPVSAAPPTAATAPAAQQEPQPTQRPAAPTMPADNGVQQTEATQPAP